MKILQIVSSTSDDCGGVTIAVKNLASALVCHGHKVDVCGTRRDIENIQETLKDGYRLYEFPVQQPRQYYFSPHLGTFLKKTIKEYDVVHIHGIWTYPTFIASRACKISHIPYVIRTCGMLDRWSMSQKRIRKLVYFYLLEKQNLENASFIQFSTEVEFKRLFYKKWDSKKLKYIPNILNLEEINKSSAKPDGRLVDKKYILFFGRLTYKKGLDILIKAFNSLQQNSKYKDIYLVLMGYDEDNYFKRLKRHMSYLKVWDSVINIGMIYGENRFSVVKNALFSCLPSRQENLGLTIIESLACGAPVVVSESIDLADVIKKECLGRLSPLDSVHLCAIIKEMIDCGDKRLKMAENGRRFVYGNFTKEAIIEKDIGMYKEAIEKEA